MFVERLGKIVEESYAILREKIRCNGIAVENEASFQLQYAYILKSLGELYEFSKDDNFLIELESNLKLKEPLIKSKSKNARIDIIISMENKDSKSKCAIELKFFKKSNHREPNNRYDVFLDLFNLEKYQENGIDTCYFILATNHEHYVNQDSYSEDTKDFDFREGRTYTAGTLLSYNTVENLELIEEKGFRPNIELKNDYNFEWDRYENMNFLKIKLPTKSSSETKE